MGLKVLLAGNNRALVQEILSKHNDQCDCQSSTTHRNDLESHLESFIPDVIVFCLYKEPQENLYKLPSVAEVIRKKNAVVAITGDLVDCDAFERAAPGLARVTLRKPVSTAEIMRTVIALSSERMHDIEMKEMERVEEEKAKERKEEALREMQKKAKERAEERQRQIEQERARVAENSTADKTPEVWKPSPSILAEAFSKPKKKRILAVDDDSSILKVIKNYLEEDYDVATAVNSKVAMRYLTTKHVDLVLLDYEMPDESGAKLLERIRKTERLEKLPVLFLTGITAQGKIKEVLALRPQGYLLKPIGRENLHQEIKKVLQ